MKYKRCHQMGKGNGSLAFEVRSHTKAMEICMVSIADAKVKQEVTRREGSYAVRQLKP